MTDKLLRLRVFENTMLRRIFELKRDEVTGEWRKLHNEKLNDLYSSPNIIRVKNEMGGLVASMGERRSAYRVSVRKPEGRIPLGRPYHIWEYNIKMDLQDVRWVH